MIEITIWIRIKDDRPVHDDLNSVSVKWGFGHDVSRYNTTEYQIPDDGVIELKVRKNDLDLELIF